METITKLPYEVPPSNITRDRKWLVAELDMADALFARVIEEIQEHPSDELDETMVPDPDEFFACPEPYVEIWDAHKERMLNEFATTHAKSLEAEQKEKERKLEHITLTPEEILAKRVAELESGEEPYIIPESFYEARKALNTMMTCTFSSYISLLGGLYKLMKVEFPKELATLMNIEPLDSDPASEECESEEEQTPVQKVKTI